MTPQTQRHRNAIQAMQPDIKLLHLDPSTGAASSSRTGARTTALAHEPKARHLGADEAAALPAGPAAAEPVELHLPRQTLHGVLALVARLHAGQHADALQHAADDLGDLCRVH